jgi:membrane protein
LIIIAVATCGLVLGRGTARSEMIDLLSQAMGQRAAGAIDGWVEQAWRSGAAASIVGLALSVFTASRVVVQLEQALNHTWNIEVSDPPDWKSTVRLVVRKRLYAVLLVAASGPLLLLVLGTRALLSTTAAWVYAGTGLGIVIQVSQFAFSLVLVAVLTALVFKVVPRADVDWRSIWLGASVTSLLFNLGNLGLGLYLGQASVSAAYGAAGSAIVVLLWLYFSAMFFLFGAEFAQTYALRFGKGMGREASAQVSDERSAIPPARGRHGVRGGGPT